MSTATGAGRRDRNTGMPAETVTGGQAPGRLGVPAVGVRAAGQTGARGVFRMVASRRRRVPHLLAGVLLVVGCVVVFAVGAVRATGRVPVLAVARDVQAGQVLTADDVRVVEVAADRAVSTVPATRRNAVIGATVAVPRPAGALLSQRDVGPAGFPPPGRAVVAVAVTPGRFPPAITPGTPVRVLIAPAENPAAGGVDGGPGEAPVSLAGVIVSVSGTGETGNQARVLSVVMDRGDAETVGAAGDGTVSVVQVPANTPGMPSAGTR